MEIKGFTFLPRIALLTFLIGVFSVFIWISVRDRDKKPLPVEDHSLSLPPPEAVLIDANENSETPDFSSERVYYENKSDPRLEKSIISVVGISAEDYQRSRYFYNRVDLNGDRNPEVLVYVFGSMNCGTGGCDVLMFQNEGGDYKLVTSFGPARNPVTVSDYKTNGWRDLIFYNRGGGINPGYYSVCRFNGQSYPKNPSNKKEAPPLKSKVRGTEYLVDDQVEDSNLEPGLGFSRRLLK